ncbi:MAG: hypothetical protein DRQ51_06665 [Gammaproteobacteria bacterium]|nr:MAG: hypothetical protein DRQ51_06665 [Gammaproteobacteria bacterium]
MLKDRMKWIRKHCYNGTQEAFSEKLNVNIARIKSIETGRVKDITATELHNMVNNFNLNTKWILTGEGEKYNKKQEKQLYIDEDLTGIIEWQYDFYNSADEDNRAWFKVQFKKAFPDYQHHQTAQNKKAA